MKKLLGLALVGVVALSSCGTSQPPPGAYDASGLWDVELTYTYSTPSKTPPSVLRYVAAVSMANKPNPGDFTMTLVPVGLIGSTLASGNTVRGTVVLGPAQDTPVCTGAFKGDRYTGTCPVPDARADYDPVAATLTMARR